MHAWRLGLLVIVVGCASDPMGPDDTTPDPVTLTITSPTPGMAFARDHVSAATADLVASIPVTVAVDGEAARVGLSIADTQLGDVDAAGMLTIDLASSATIVATAYDAAGTALATAMVDVTTTLDIPSDCHAALDLYGVAYTVGPDRMGVVDPVTATVPLNGVGYRAVGATNARSTQFADCKLILSLAKATPFFRARGVTEVTDYGIYNYRCIGGGQPPCENGISQHAYATAIDIAALTRADGEYVVNDDWVIDPDSEDTCAAPTEPGKDEFLHEIICALKDADTWNIVLTPNYNAAHRNHFHVDLTPGSNFIE